MCVRECAFCGTAAARCRTLTSHLRDAGGQPTVHHRHLKPWRRFEHSCAQLQRGHLWQWRRGIALRHRSSHSPSSRASFIFNSFSVQMCCWGIQKLLQPNTFLSHCSRCRSGFAAGFAIVSFLFQWLGWPHPGDAVIYTRMRGLMRSVTGGLAGSRLHIPPALQLLLPESTSDAFPLYR
jgi:hypothetical protein